MEAVEKLMQLGFSFYLIGDKIHYAFVGAGRPDPDLVKRLLAEIKRHKRQATKFLIEQGRHVKEPRTWDVLTSLFGAEDGVDRRAVELEVFYRLDERLGLGEKL